MVERFNPLQEYINIKNQIESQQEIFMMGQRRTPNRTSKLSGPSLADAKGLIRFKIRDGIYIYARNEKEAEKRAKKRGLWTDDSKVEKEG